MMHELICVPIFSTDDWEMATGVTTLQAINASMTKWLNGPKTPGLIILEHELDNSTSQSFIDAHPLMVSTGWKIESVAQVAGNSVYLNSDDSISPVQPANGVLLQTLSPPASSTSSTSTSSSTPAQSTGGSNNAGSNTSQNGRNGSMQLTLPKFAGALGVVFLTVVFYAW